VAVSVLVVSGTGTGVGKTVVTAAVAAVARAGGRRVAVVKPAQTGVVPDEPADLDEVGRLAGVDADDRWEVLRYPSALSPEAAARVDGRPPLDLGAVADLVVGLTSTYDVVLVEGAGGLLVRYDPGGTTVADLAAAVPAPVLVVTEPGLGTLNVTALTLEALAAREVACAGLVVGAWPAEPGLAERSNLRDLETLGRRPLAGVLPAGAAGLDPAAFLAAAVAGLDPSLGGAFDAADFRRTHDLPEG
jgi:dethiobiotin synthetase